MAAWNRLAPVALALGLGTTAAAQTTGFGPSWTHQSENQGWTPKNIALGDRGGQVLTQFGAGYDFSRLFSATDQGPALPVWENHIGALSYNQRTASADETDVYVTLHDQALTASTRRLYLRKFRSSSETPEWTYELPTITNTHDLFDVAVSEDGSRIVAATVNPATTEVDVFVLGPNSPTPQRTVSVPLFGFMRGLDLSADGSRLLVASDLFAKVVDLDNGVEVDAITLSISPLTLAISGNGDAIAIGGQNALSVMALDDDGDYEPVFTKLITGSWYCREADISAGGETLACGFVGYGSGRGIKILRLRPAALDRRRRRGRDDEPRVPDRRLVLQRHHRGRDLVDGGRVRGRHVGRPVRRRAGGDGLPPRP